MNILIIAISCWAFIKCEEMVEVFDVRFEIHMPAHARAHIHKPHRHISSFPLRCQTVKNERM